MRIVFNSGSREGQAVDIDSSGLTIGRADDNDIQLSDVKVSGRHAVIERDDGGRVVLRDLDSRNGTFVDGVRLVGPRVLAGGEQVRIGDEQLQIGDEQPEVATAAAPGRVGLGRRHVLLAVVALAVVAVVVAQFVLPGVAERSLRSDLGEYGPVQDVGVHAVPAIKLLWKRADRVNVEMDSYRSEPGGHGSLADFLSRTRSTGELDARVGQVEAQLLTLHDVRLQKDGDNLVGQARLTQPDLRAALPTFVGLRPISASRNGIVVRARASVLGHRARVNVRILADEGKVVVRPDGLPFASIASVKVFSDPRVYVDSLGAELRGDQYLLTARGHLE